MTSIASLIGYQDRDAQRRTVQEFSILFQIYYPLNAGTALIGLWFSIFYKVYLCAPLALVAILIALHQHRAWRKADLNNLNFKQVERRVRTLENISFSLMCLTPFIWIPLMAYLPRTEMMMVALVLGALAVGSSVSLYLLPVLNRINVPLILGPAIIYLLSTAERDHMILGGMMVLWGGAVMLITSTLGRGLGAYHKAREQDSRRAEMTARAMSDLLRRAQPLHCQLSLNGRILDLSHDLAKLYGKEISHFLNKPIENLCQGDHPTTIITLSDIRMAMIAGDPFSDMEMVARNSAGERLILSVTGTPTYDPDGRLAGYCVWVENVTDARRRSVALRESEARLGDFTSLARDCFWETDAHHRYTLLLGNLDPMAETGRGRLLGKHPPLAAEEGLSEEYEEAVRVLREAIGTKSAFEGVILPSPSGRIFCHSGVPRRRSDGTFMGFRGVSQDITAEYNAQRAAEEANKALADANQHLNKALTAARSDVRELPEIDPEDARHRVLLVTSNAREGRVITKALHERDFAVVCVDDADHALGRARQAMMMGQGFVFMIVGHEVRNGGPAALIEAVSNDQLLSALSMISLDHSHDILDSDDPDLADAISQALSEAAISGAQETLEMMRNPRRRRATTSQHQALAS